MVGFDLDGVLVADIPYSDDTVSFRNSGMNALFVPTGKYAIVTGRPNSKAETLAWADRELSKNPPRKIYCDNTDWRLSDLYKREVLRAHPEIEIFVESDPTTALFLQREFPQKYIIHFASWVASALEMSIKREEV